jgi:hypothetical protein
MQMLKDQKEPNKTVVRNGLFMILTLFSQKDQGIDLRGTDIQELSPGEKEDILSSLQDLFDPHCDANL